MHTRNNHELAWPISLTVQLISANLGSRCHDRNVCYPNTTKFIYLCLCSIRVLAA